MEIDKDTAQNCLEFILTLAGAYWLAKPQQFKRDCLWILSRTFLTLQVLIAIYSLISAGFFGILLYYKMPPALCVIMLVTFIGSALLMRSVKKSYREAKDMLDNYKL